ncbi:MAG TPA: EAL domain-containing protein [Sulfurimonas sp.]|uniref:EAL domain-containing protein n=1 Tax=Sulfurimonas sp. TaxID=2022749 RepID=UPI002C74F09F|nr:EAL domain-containing protein [Sulfurimonas sp.]HUH41865.1 EAL domain-containing protein [Sulfurimonas sp.]
MKLKLKSKLLFLSILPTLFIAILSFMLLSDIIKDRQNLNLTKQYILEAEAISKVIHYMQIERGITAGMIAHNKTDERDINLQDIKTFTDKAVLDAYNILSKCDLCDSAEILNTLQEIKNRDNSKLLTLLIHDAKQYYTKKTESLLLFIKKIPSMMNDKENRNHLQAQSYLSSAKEALGQIRATLMEVYSNKKLSENSLMSLVKFLEIYNLECANFKAIATDDLIAIYENHFKGEAVEKTMSIINSILEHRHNTDLSLVESSYWFEQSTISINALRAVEHDLFARVLSLIDNKKNLIFYKILLVSLFLLFTIITLVFISVLIVRKILSSTDSLEKNYDDSISLLEQYRATVDRSFIVSKTDAKGIITYVNDEFCKISGFSRDELVGKYHNILRHPEMQKKIFKEMWHTLRDLKKPWQGEILNLKKDGSSYWIKAIINPILDKDSEVVEYIAIRTDITEIKNALIIDALTGYNNRVKLSNDIKELKNISLSVFNLDDFRQLNDFYGHEFGNLVIIEMANKIYNFISKDKKLKFYRLQGDEFVVVGIQYDRELFIKKTKEILLLVKERFTMQNEEILLSCSCGISFEDDDHILLGANMALKTAKKSGIDLLVYNDSLSLNEQYKNNMIVTKKIADALNNNNIITYYQPIVNNTDLAYEKYECLVRMRDGDEILPPAFFLDIAKQSKQYFGITKAVVLQAFEMFKDKETEVSINLSINDMLDEEVSNYILMMLDKYKIGNRVIFEIVESEYINNFEGVLKFIKSVKRFNCKIAIDDFGTGYSNFGYLIKLRPEYLKIDGSLIKNIDKDRNARLIVSTIVDFSHKLGMKIVAEFVESEEIFKIVKELGVDSSQGYFFSKPKESL